MRFTPLLASVSLLAGCFCLNPWTRFPMQAPPDESYAIGGSVFGDDVYSWTCIGGQHVVIHQYSAEMTCQAAEREQVPCGQLTAFEQKHATTRRTPSRRPWRT